MNVGGAGRYKVKVIRDHDKLVSEYKQLSEVTLIQLLTVTMLPQ